MVGDGVSMERRVRPHAMFAVEGVKYREIYGRPPLVLYIILLYFKILGYVFNKHPGFKCAHNSTSNIILFKT